MGRDRPSLPPRFTSEAAGGGVYEIVHEGANAVDAATLRKRLGVIEALEKAAGGARIVAADADHSLEELTRLAKNIARSAKPHILSVIDTPGAAAALEQGGAHVWRVRGAEGAVFASTAAPAYVPEVESISKHIDFAKPRAKTLRLLRKDAGEPGEILPDQQIVYGIVLEPETVDSQGDIYSAAEIESACHLYLENFQQVGHMHQTMLTGDTARVVESYIAPCDFTMGVEPVKAGTWVLVIHVLSAELWGQIMRGELTGLSIGGWAQRVPTGGSEAAASP